MYWNPKSKQCGTGTGEGLLAKAIMVGLGGYGRWGDPGTGQEAKEQRLGFLFHDDSLSEGPTQDSTGYTKSSTFSYLIASC